VEWLASRWTAQVSQTRDLLAGELRERFRTLAQRLEKRLDRASGAGDETRFADALAEAAFSSTEDLIGSLTRISGPADEAGTHAARIACKRLRYLIEPLRGSVEAGADLVEACKGLQTLLGELNDAAAMSSAVDAALAESAAVRAARVGELVRAGYADRARREAWFTEWPGLIELAQILTDERAALFARLKREWLDLGAGLLRARAQALADSLRALLHGQPEIERKFLLTRLPSLEGRNASSVLIEQGWLPGTSLRERLRSVSGGPVTRYFRTLKLGSGVRRTELEEEVTAEVHAELWPRTLGCRLRKRRHRVREGELMFEIDEFLDRELVLAEVELPDEEVALVLPDWLTPSVVREVTGEPDYTGGGLGR
jgi:CYTH domain-containing protein